MNILLAILLGVAVVGGVILFLAPGNYELPKLREDPHWGPGDKPKTPADTSIKPFKLKWNKEMVEDLKHRLKNTRTPQPSFVPSQGWTYGMKSDFVSVIVNHWLNKYDFAKREEHLNRFPQFTTEINGLKMHFVHVKPQLPKDRKVEVVPLLILHGWPGSVVEFQKIIPMLTTPRADRDFVFELIAPSLPGYGFSDAAAKKDLGAVEIAQVMNNLMQRLGFKKYFTQGGDWGAVITAYMAALFPDNVLGMHSNMCLVLDIRTLWKVAAVSLFPPLLPQDERAMLYPLKNVIKYLIEETGYFHEQATKPDTLGVGLTDSPAALAAYLLEKFSVGTNSDYRLRDDGGLPESFDFDELIDNLMYYWVPNKATSAVRLYAESFNIRELSYRMDRIPIKVPSACAVFPHEFLRFPEVFLRDRFVNLVHYSKQPKGGHFAAMEVPDLLADDVFVAIHKMRAYYVEQEQAKKQEKAEF